MKTACVSRVPRLQLMLSLVLSEEPRTPRTKGPRTKGPGAAMQAMPGPVSARLRRALR